MTELFRAVMRAHDNGQEFPVYVRDRDEADEAAQQLKADVLELVPSSHESQQIEMLTTMFSRAFGYK